jgi:hypothetical protein
MAKILTFSAKTNRELGSKMGSHFRRQIKRKLRLEREQDDWESKCEFADRYLADSQRFFPQYLDELRAYADAACVSFADLWTSSLEIDPLRERCTTAVSPRGAFVAHSEDFDDVGSARDVFVVKKILPKVTVLELLYFYTLGGNASGVNSHGITFATNTLHSGFGERGVARNVIARFLCELRNPLKDAARLRKMPIAEGYAHTFATPGRATVSIEYSRKGVIARRVTTPYAHTNHFTTELVVDEMWRSKGSELRYVAAKDEARGIEGLADAKALLADRRDGPKRSIHNDDTIARLVFDQNAREMHVRLMRNRLPKYQKIPFPKRED